MHRARTSIGALCVAFATLGAAAWPHAAAAQAIGSPFYSIILERETYANGWDPNRIVAVSTDHAIGGDMARLWDMGPSYHGSAISGPAALVTNFGATFWGEVITPANAVLPAAPDASVGGRATVDVYQSFRKTSADAQLDFTYSSAYLELYKDVEIFRPCDDCIRASVSWAAEVYLNGPGDQQTLWSQSQSASVYDDNGIFRFEASNVDSAASPVNPQWGWDCPDCGASSRGLHRATLQAPFTGIVDLSGIPFDPLLPPELQPEFTVHYTLVAYGVDRGTFSRATAWARDPLGGTGFELSISGLTPTDNPTFLAPVPEPGAWALMLGGLAVVGRLARRRRSMAMLAAAAPLALSAGAAQAQATQTSRYATAWGYFVVGYATMGDTGDEELIADTLQAVDSLHVFDTGGVHDMWNPRTPVDVDASFDALAWHDFGAAGIQAGGTSTLALSRGQDYVTAGGRVGTQVVLGFHVDDPIEYRFTASIAELESLPDDVRSVVRFAQTNGGVLDHFFNAAGHYDVSGLLGAGDYALSGSTTAYRAGTGQFAYSLQLGPVPEPGTWALWMAGLAGMGGIARRRRAGTHP